MRPGLQSTPGTLGAVSPRAPRLIAALLILWLALVGCVKLDGDVTLSPEGTVSGTAIVAVHQDWALGQGQDPALLQSLLVDELAEEPDTDIDAEPYDDGTYIGATLTLRDVDVERISEATNGVIIITAEDDVYEVGGRFGDLDVSAPSADGEVPTPWIIDLSVTFPESVAEHDGRASGRTVTWEREPGEDELHALSEPGSSVPMTAIAFGALILAGGVLVFVVRRRSRKAANLDDATEDED